MAITIGVNAGFVSSAPSGDPAGGAIVVEGYIFAVQDTLPATAGTITEIGWYCPLDSSSGADMEGCIYDDDGSDSPTGENIIGSKDTGNTGGSAGWKSFTGLNIDVSSHQNTLLWIAVQVDIVSGTVGIDKNDAGIGNGFLRSSQTELPDPCPSGTENTRYYAIYAVWEAAAEEGTNFQINIGDDWKSVDAIQINIGDDWKAVSGAQVNIGDAWKEIF